MKIDKIKKVGNKYKIIFVDGSVINTYDEVIINNNILFKKELDDCLIDKINRETLDYDVYSKVLKYINTKLRSEYEVRRYLERQGVGCSASEVIIRKLKNSNLINDFLFVKAFVHDRLSFSNDGPFKIKRDLLSHEIDDDIIEKELASVSFNEKLSKLIVSKVNKNTKYSNSMLKQKLLIYFVNLGYDRNDILSILEKNVRDNNLIIRKEYDKLYNKFKNKYSDDELSYVIKNKLYQKGFNSDEINEVLQ